jgi:hypothetical protein
MFYTKKFPKKASFHIVTNTKVIKSKEVANPPTSEIQPRVLKTVLLFIVVSNEASKLITRTASKRSSSTGPEPTSLVVKYS